MLGFGRPHRPKVVAFDIIGTVFDLEPLRPRLEGLGLPETALELLYATSLRDAMALACADRFVPFKGVMKGALWQILAEKGLSATDEEMDEALSLMRSLPPHPDAREAFGLLHQAGVRVFALSNGANSATRSLLEKAGMVDLVEEILSVDDVKLSKPRPEVYLHAVETARVRPGEMMLVAAHPWDINGAKTAGLMGGYVCRGVPFPGDVMTAPDIEGDSLAEIARAVTGMKA
jgi:2-haloacid dehalogenase